MVAQARSVVAANCAVGAQHARMFAATGGGGALQHIRNCCESFVAVNKCNRNVTRCVTLVLAFGVIDSVLDYRSNAAAALTASAARVLAASLV